MRQDGDITFYIVEAQYVHEEDKQSKGKWFIHCDTGCYGQDIHDGTHKLKPDDDPTCGTIWQRTGYDGVTNVKAGERWLMRTINFHLKHLEDEKYRCRFRLSKRRMLQETTEITRIERIKNC